MPSAFLSRNSFNQLKRAARQQLPGVQHSHVLEALARALGHNNLAALNAALAVGEDTAVRFFLFSYHDLRIRLAELGYSDALTWDLDFSCVTDVFRVKRPFPSTLDALLADGIISLEHRRRFDQLIDQRKSILIIGATSSGKSLLMHVLLNEMAIRAPGDAFVVLEVTRSDAEYPPNVDRFVKSERGPDEPPHFCHRRVAFDELRDGIASNVLRSWTAYGGGLGTLYARSVEDVIPTLTELLGGRGVGSIHEAIDIVVRMERSDKPRVAEIVNWTELQHGSEPPEFSQEWREPANLRMPPPEDVGRYVLQDLRRLVSERFSAGDQVPLSPDMPFIHDDLRMRDGQPYQDGLSFTPKHWTQAEDGSWAPSSASFFGHSHHALHGPLNDVLTKERMDEMSRIIAEGGRVIVMDPKVDTDVARALNGKSESITQTRRNSPPQPDSDTTSDSKSD